MYRSGPWKAGSWGRQPTPANLIKQYARWTHPNVYGIQLFGFKYPSERRIRSTWHGAQWTMYIHSFAPGLCPFLPSLSQCNLKESKPSESFAAHHLGPCYWWYRVIQTWWEVANSLVALATYMCFKAWVINPTKIQGLATLVKCLGVQWSRSCWIIISKIKIKFLYFVPSQLRKKHSAC